MLVDFLDRLAEKLDSYPSLNSGGCGVFAYHVGRQLEKMGVDVTVRFLTDHEIAHSFKMDVVCQARPYTMDDWNWESGDCINGHVILEIKIDGNTYYYDSGGVTDQYVCEWEWMDMIPEAFSLEHLEGMISDQEGWNEMFEVTGPDAWEVRQRIEKEFDKLLVCC